MRSVTIRPAILVLAAYPPIVAALSVVNVVAPQRNGPLAITEVFAPHLLLGVLVLLPLLRLTSSPILRVGMVLAIALGAVRFGPGLISIGAAGPTDGQSALVIVSWNLEAGDGSPDVLLDLLMTTDADIVALQEFTPEDAAAIETADDVTARFPHRALAPQPGVAGLGLLSRMPIAASDAQVSPAMQEVVLEAIDGQPLTIINAHPFPPHYQVVPTIRLPLDYDARGRDADLETINGHAVAAMESGFGRVILAGDFNVTDREPGYADLAAGMWDAHHEVGQGPGSTWRPSRLEFLPLGVLRIDYLFGGRGLRPMTIGEDCSPRFSDHCVLRGVVALD